jgi:hypothetical protein
VAIINIACDVERGRKTGDNHTHYEKTSEVYFIEILRVEEEIRNAQVFPETTSDHSKEYDPAKQQNLVSFQVVEEQLYRKRIGELGGKKIQPS